MPWVDIPIVGPTSKSLVPRLNSQRTVNLIPQTEEPGAKYPASLRLAPGMRSWAVGGRSPVRAGGLVMNGSTFWVVGDELVELDAAGNRTVRGTLGTSIGRVGMACSHYQVGVVDGTDDLYVWDAAAAAFTTVDLSAIAAIDDHAQGVGPTHIAMKDFYFVINRTKGPIKWRGYFYKSALNDAADFTAGDKTNAEGDPTDSVLALGATSNEVLLLGERTVQFYYNSGNPDFPFDPARGRDLQAGIGAPHSLAVSSDMAFWLAVSKEGKRSIIMYPGGPISSPDLAASMRKMTRISDAVGFCYEQDDHFFYHITFPSAGETWVYDVTTKFWHERASYGRTDHAAAGVCFFENKLLVGCDDSGLIYEWDADEHTDDGDPIQWERRCAVMHASGRPLFIEEIEVELDSGEAAANAEEPTVTLDISVDGGHVFSNEETTTIGATGDYVHQIRFGPLGAAREAVIRLRGDQDYPWTILGARMRFSLGEHAF